jgi:hypothetical protein
MAVRFKLDENLPRDAKALLRDAGHDVQTAIEERLGGNPDPLVLNACRTEDRVLVTSISISPISAYTLRRATAGSGSFDLIRKASTTRSPYCGALSRCCRAKRYTLGYGLLSLPKSVFASRREFVPNQPLNRTAKKRRFLVPSALRAPATG